MEKNSNLILTKNDFQRLSNLIMNADQTVADALEEELNRASVVNTQDLPADVVSMNSQVKFVDLDTQKETIVTLVYPQDADVAQNKISILAPIGSALIGLRVGQWIEWPIPNGKERKLKIIEVISQPEPAA